MTQWAIISLGCPSTFRSVFMLRNYWSILFWYGFKQNDWLSDQTKAEIWNLLSKVAVFLNSVAVKIYTRYFISLIFVYVCECLSTGKNYWLNRLWIFSLNLELEKNMSLFFPWWEICFLSTYINSSECGAANPAWTWLLSEVFLQLRSCSVALGSTWGESDGL